MAEPAPNVKSTPGTDTLTSSWLAPGKPVMTLEAADTMASAALKEAQSRKFKDISVFVLDAAGRVLVSKTMLNCPKLIPEIAQYALQRSNQAIDGSTR